MGGITVYSSDLDWAASQGYITEAQSQILWSQLSARYDESWKMTWVRLAYGLGAFLVVGSLTWWTDLAYQDPNSLALTFLSLAYVLGFGYSGRKIWSGAFPSIPQIVGGIFTSISVLLTPTIIFSLQRFYDWWPENFPYFAQELSLFLSAAIALRSVNFAFLAMPLCLGLYSLVMDDLCTLLFGLYVSVSQYCYLSIVFGGLSIFAWRLVDLKKLSQDYAFWGYLFGTFTFFGGITGLYYNVYYDSNVYKLIYLFVNLALMLLSVPFQRYVFAIFGGLGIAYDIGDYMAQYANIENDSWVAVIFGTVIVVTAYVSAQKNPKSPYSYWAYLFGATTFFLGWFSLFENVYSGPYFVFIYFAANVLLMLGTIFTQQGVFIFWGTIGCLMAIDEMVYTYFQNSVWLPVIITLLGLILIAIAVYLNNKRLQRKRLMEKKEDRSEVEIPLIQHQPQQEVPMVPIQMVPYDPSGQKFYIVQYYPSS